MHGNYEWLELCRRLHSCIISGMGKGISGSSFSFNAVHQAVCGWRRATDSYWPGSFKKSGCNPTAPPSAIYCHHANLQQPVDIRKLAKHVSTPLQESKKLEDFPELRVGATFSLCLHLIHVTCLVAAIEAGTHHLSPRFHCDQGHPCKRVTS